MSPAIKVFLLACSIAAVGESSIGSAQSVLGNYDENTTGNQTSYEMLEGVRDGRNREFFSGTDHATDATVRIFRNGIDESSSVRMTGRKIEFESGSAPQPGDDLRAVWVNRGNGTQDARGGVERFTAQGSAPANDRSVGKQLLRQLFEWEASEAERTLPTRRSIPLPEKRPREIPSLRMLDQTLRANAEIRSQSTSARKKKRVESTPDSNDLADYELPSIYSEIDGSDPLIRAARGIKSSISSSDRSVEARPVPESLRMLARTLRENAKRGSNSQDRNNADRSKPD
jgi:hypothetical protein